MLSEGVIKPAVIEGNGDFELSIQDHMIGQPLAEVGIRNSGKSYQAGKICEDLCEVNQPFIVIDPEGEYWTLRERYPVIVAAVGKVVGRPEGYRADLILTVDSAPVLARRVVEKGYSLILDLRNATMAESYEVLGAFLEALYECEAEFNRPLVLIMEEAHVLVPEIGRVRLPGIKKAQDRVIYWTYEIAARGRHRGLGYICIARRAAEVAKAVLSQCPNRIIFKLVDPADLGWLRQSGLTKEEIEMITKFPTREAVPRKALVIGIKDEHFLITSKPRLCTHGGKTPIAMAVETPELESAVADLSEIIESPPVEVGVSSIVVEELRARIAGYEDQVPRLKKTIEDLELDLKEEKRLKMEVVDEKIDLKSETQKLRDQVKTLEGQVLSSEDRFKYQAKITRLETDITSLKEQLSAAGELESELERVREVFRSWKDLMLETSAVLGLELIPSDIEAVIQERDELKNRVDIYEREAQLEKELMSDTLSDRGIKSWINDAKGTLRTLRGRGGTASEIVLKAVLRMDPEVVFLPEEIETGYTAQTTLKSLNVLVSRGLCWEAQRKGRKAFRNRLRQWVAENVRRIKPSAPDPAIEEITEELKRTVIR